MNKKALLLGTFMMILPILTSAQTTVKFTGYQPIPDVVESSLDGFYKENPDIKVIFERCGFSDCHKKLTVALSVKKGLSQIYAVSSFRISTYASSNGLVNLSKPPYNMGSKNWEFSQSMVQLGKGPNGEDYGIPYDAGPVVVSYRKDILQKSGKTYEEITKSWEAYHEFAKLIKKKFDVYIGSSATEIFSDVTIWQNAINGGSVYLDEKGKPNLASPIFVKTVTMLQQMYKEGLFVQVDGATSSPEFVKLFSKGKIFATIDGPWSEGRIRDVLDPEGAKEGKWAVGNLPGNTFVNEGGTLLVMPKAAKNLDAAWKLMEYLQRPENAVRIASVGGSLPARTDIFNHPYFKQENKVFIGQNTWKIYADYLPKMKPFSANKIDSIAMDIISNAIKSVIANDGDVKTALEKANAKLAKRMALMD